ncbi:hypothetical protein [Aureimonas ureilytica]|uniref:hypothetical protein n=1 Tax=Aureimonas ureilytica TaxID=401562 RepID=UPI000733EA09|nr:hypothetical protein [Aureimonas ureilytica]
MSGGRYELVTEIVEAAGGEIVGRIRLQKIVYLLEKMGMDGGFKFSYYHYGPYSEDLTSAVDVARFADKAIVEEVGHTSYGSPYSIYKLGRPASPSQQLGSLDAERARSAIARMKRDQSVVIELAATIYWLKEEERVPDWVSELKRRKANKATDPNIALAERLLADIGL